MTPVCAEDGIPANGNAHSHVREDRRRFRLTEGDRLSTWDRLHDSPLLSIGVSLPCRITDRRRTSQT
jgi:hypothetical protein